MRSDGRRSDELRRIEIIPDYSTYAEGSVLISLGNTRVLCNLTIEEGVPRWMQAQTVTGGWVTAEYAMLPRATHQRTPRETERLGGRTQEIRRLIGRSLRAAVDLKLLGQRTYILDCDVLQADGGTRTAAITGGYLALGIGLRRLINKRSLSQEALLPPVAAVSVGILNGVPLLDLCYAEDRQADVDANIVMNAAGRFIEIQMTAEGNPFTPHQYQQMLDLAYQGIGELITAQQATFDKLFASG